MRLLLKGIFATILLLFLGIFLYFYIDSKAPLPSHVTYGITYSPRYATYLGLDWKQAYLEILRDLHPSEIRLVAYWDEIAPTATTYYFDDLDWLIHQAASSGVNVTLAVGQKLPRWPECYPPSWLKGDIKQPLLSYLATVVGRYKSEPNLTAWQVENEPYFDFGQCVQKPETYLLDELSLVKKTDPAHPVFTTESGEWGSYSHVNNLTDYMGISIYRKVQVNMLLGDVPYPIPANYYRIKAQIKNWNKNQMIVTELQMEPWLHNGARDSSIQSQLKLFNAQNFNENLTYAKNTGFKEILMWGTEWWLYAKNQGYPEVWQAAQKAFAQAK